MMMMNLTRRKLIIYYVILLLHLPLLYRRGLQPSACLSARVQLPSIHHSCVAMLRGRHTAGSSLSFASFICGAGDTPAFHPRVLSKLVHHRQPARALPPSSPSPPHAAAAAGHHKCECYAALTCSLALAPARPASPAASSHDPFRSRLARVRSRVDAS